MSVGVFVALLFLPNSKEKKVKPANDPEGPLHWPGVAFTARTCDTVTKASRLT